MFAGLCALRYPDVAADDSSFRQCDTSQHGGVAIDDDVVFEDGVAGDALDGVAVFVEWETLRSESDTLIELYVVADDAGGTDDNTRPVVDGEVVSNLCAWVDVDACLAVSHLRDDTRDEGHTQ